LAVVKEFYDEIVANDNPTLADCYKLIDKETALGYEEFLFEKACSNNHIDDEVCIANIKKHENTESDISLLCLRFKIELGYLYQNYTNKQIGEVLNHSTITPYVYGHANSILVTLIFPNKRHLYFLIGNYDDEKYLTIDNIFIEDGRSLYNKIYRDNNYLSLPGRIVDKDGFTNVRTEPSIKSDVAFTIPSGGEIWFTPNDDCTWWRVESAKDRSLKGYVYFDRISCSRR
jgi:hypothetical protein